MYPPDCVLAPQSCQALPPEGRLWPSDDNDELELGEDDDDNDQDNEGIDLGE